MTWSKRALCTGYMQILQCLCEWLGNLWSLLSVVFYNQLARDSQEQIHTYIYGCMYIQWETKRLNYSIIWVLRNVHLWNLIYILSINVSSFFLLSLTTSLLNLCCRKKALNLSSHMDSSSHQAPDKTHGYIVFEPRFCITSCVNDLHLNKECGQCTSKNKERWSDTDTLPKCVAQRQLYI